jgi:alkylation response protein AidB-like acyl-CoA dehydrogenase
MPSYKTPLKDIQFVFNELLDYPTHYERLKGCAEASTDLVDAVMNEAAKFSEEVLSPLNRVGDQQGCTWTPDGVIAPQGFKEAYKQYVDNGWPLLSVPEALGGQGLPSSLSMAVTEAVSTANVSWSGYPGLSQGAIKTLIEHGTEWQRDYLLPKLVSGEWTGTMCLTESHCGSDLGQLRTRAVPNDDGSYGITGTKIFISSGDHDMADNIVHIVLARLPDAPAGTAGISLFAVPKFNVSDAGEIADRNGVKCGSIEHKMGIHGFATCVMNFDGAKGYLIGEPNKGLACMFTFMNHARLATGMQGLVHSEIAYQGAIPYAHDRLAMRSLSGPKNPDGPADPIIVHPDVRRLLLTIKAITEGCRALSYYTAQQLDLSEYGESEEVRKRAESLLALITPICKGFMTELGVEAASHGIQVFGGHGYISEWGMEQNLRDSRISTLYEGTTGIQALDLLGRKVLGSGGKLLQPLLAEISHYCEGLSANAQMQEFAAPLQEAVQSWQEVSMQAGTKAMENPEEVGAASVDYLMISGYTLFAYLWARMADVAQQQIGAGAGDEAFYQAKVHTARFYFQRLLPRIATHKATLGSGADNLMAMPEACFVLN